MITEFVVGAVLHTVSRPYTLRHYTVLPANIGANTFEGVCRVNKWKQRKSVKGFGLIINFTDAASIFIFYPFTLVLSTNSDVTTRLLL